MALEVSLFATAADVKEKAVEATWRGCECGRGEAPEGGG